MSHPKLFTHRLIVQIEQHHDDEFQTRMQAVKHKIS